MHKTLERWHEFVAAPNPAILNEILAEDCVFHSPVVWKPKVGRTAVTMVLMAASTVFRDFEYIREVVDDENAVYEFEAGVGELTVRGVDMLRLDHEGKICDFEVMLRPANAVQAVGIAMASALGVSGER